MQDILIIGATGLVGTQVLKFIEEDKASIRLLVRKKEASHKLAKSGYKIFFGDIDDQNILLEAINGTSKVFLVTTPSPDQVSLHKKVIDACNNAGKPHLVRLSTLAIELAANKEFDINIINWHAETEAYLEQSGLPYTHIRPSYFMQNFNMQKDLIINDSKFYGAAGKGTISPIHVEDIAKFVATVLLEDGHENKVYELTSGQLLSFNKMAEIISNTIGQAVEYIDVPLDIFHESLLKAGKPGWFADGMCAIYKSIAHGKFSSQKTDFKKICGSNPMLFGSYVKDSFLNH